MYQLLLTHLPVARTIVAGVDLTTIAADGANQCDEENSAMEVLSDCSPGCVLATEVPVHLDCKFYWLCFCEGSSMDRELLLWWLALEVPVF